ncbi:putative F-box domain-containing protein [Lupinus albus]|uniref:Putative F-box domain-containing protein n=1 Tax=Lupinus albus TaxID=3870 RepID=A0A6A4PU07_LUPAL|nr:putative F-box domain-containing protein [Lupinus albus]
MKRQRESERDINNIDRLEDMSDFFLLHIMKFMNVKDVVQTCILSKRWKNLWKSMTNLTLYCLDKSYIFSKFVSQMLSDHDSSLPLQNLDFAQIDTPQTTLLEVIE